MLWDLERAEKLRGLPAPGGGRSRHWPSPAIQNQFVVASQAGSGSALRHPHAFGAGGRFRRPGRWRAGDRQRPGRGSSLQPARIAASGYGAPTRAGLARTWRGQGDMPSALGIAPGGRTVASGSAGGSVRFWSTSASRMQRSFKAHDGRVTALAFAPSQRPHARHCRRRRTGEALGYAQHRGAPRVFRGHAGPVHSGCVLARWPPPALRRAGRRHPHLEQPVGATEGMTPAPSAKHDLTSAPTRRRLGRTSRAGVSRESPRR